VAGIFVKAAQIRKHQVAPVRRGDVTDQQLHHRSPFLGPGRIQARHLGGGTDEIAVVEMMVVECLVAAIRRLAADERAPVGVVVKHGLFLARRGGEPLFQTAFDFRNEDALQFGRLGDFSAAAERGELAEKFALPIRILEFSPLLVRLGLQVIHQARPVRNAFRWQHG
jgi:hypothetical protein